MVLKDYVINKQENNINIFVGLKWSYFLSHIIYDPPGQQLYFRNY